MAPSTTLTGRLPVPLLSALPPGGREMLRARGGGCPAADVGSMAGL
jgi:hypothetical protein